MPYVRSHDRLRLFYADAGTGQPLVFVASAWLDSRMWDFRIPYLVDHGFRCVAYDRRGTAALMRRGTATTTTRSPTPMRTPKPKRIAPAIATPGEGCANTMSGS